MKIRKPIVIYLPKRLVVDLNSYLASNPPSFSVNKEHVYYIVHYLINKQNRFKDMEWHSLDSSKLKSITSTQVGRYISLLKKGEFIISNRKHSKGDYSQKFKLNEKYVDEVIEYKINPYSRLGRKILKKQHNKKAHFNRLEPHLKAMQERFFEVDFDQQSAKKMAQIEPDPVKRLNYLTAINHISDKRFRYFRRNRTNNRLDTNLTNLKKDYRCFWGQDLVSIDLKNSQPYLSSVLIAQLLHTRDIYCEYLSLDNIAKAFGIRALTAIAKIHQNQKNENLVSYRNFERSVIDGNLYDDFTKHYEGDLNREEAKEIMFKVFFSKNYGLIRGRKHYPYYQEKQVFKSVYPFVYPIFTALKGKGKQNSRFPIFLQKLESYIFIDVIAKRLVEQGIIPFTIHDSMIVPRKHQERTLDIMKTAFQEQFGVVPTFEVTNL